jgi:hypothetical protein
LELEFDELFELVFEELFELEFEELLELVFDELFELVFEEVFDELLLARMIWPCSAFKALTAEPSGAPTAACAPVVPSASTIALAVKVIPRFMARSSFLGCDTGSRSFRPQNETKRGEDLFQTSPRFRRLVCSVAIASSFGSCKLSIPSLGGLGVPQYPLALALLDCGLHRNDRREAFA